MRIAVTGATGFIGRHVVTEALRRGHDLIAVVRTPDRPMVMAWRHDVEVRAIDIRAASEDPFDKIGRPDLCIHLAWGTLADFNNLDHFESELPAQYAFLSRLVRGGLPRLLVAGTCLEYGLQSGCLDEKLSTSPVTPYGLAKDTLRRQLEFLHSRQDFSLAWARQFYVHGEGEGRRTLFTQLKAAVDRGDATFPMSGGEQLRDYLAVETMAERLVQLATMAVNPGIVNVCSGEPVSVRRLVDGWLATNGWNIALDLGRYEYPAHEPLAFWGNRRKLDRCIGLQDQDEQNAFPQNTASTKIHDAA
jgi:dTDP-6-deoxy-L-talose 4-dehydrogenase (NAD+)